MSVKKKDFFGKDVADVIAQACSFFKASQEDLNIEVIETGSTGIFGLIRKKAQIRVSVRAETLSERIESESVHAQVAAPKKTSPEKKQAPKKESSTVKKDIIAEPQEAPTADGSLPSGEDAPPVAQKPSSRQEVPVQHDSGSERKVSDPVVSPAKSAGRESVPEEDLAQDDLDLIRDELVQLLTLMGYPAQVEIESRGLAVRCQLKSDYDEILTGEEGKTLDSIQYLLRKMVSRKVAGRIRLVVDVAGFREKRLDELQDRARELAQLVKADGKTQIIPALNPSERRVVHLVLQEDKEIRSRSVGDGLFKKIFIYKPGKGKSGGGRRRPSSRSRKGKGGSKPTPGNDES
ncbi:MAG: Jag N-terminal domain-containing protein [Desulfobulbaceae bacterium]|uniref:RNA-binding protein KhpB n=1 Tax=Candidatus Desulfatifera sulfidica TaxID=2841691 RepID=A0A8J6N9D1_9BACT|nr:Jag N-terminal domain-containing protein [Candidatus Desulfatifera sulfidica]